jgi:hypothetical protein
MHPDPDHNLICFLKKHQPLSPPSSSHSEERLLLLVRQSPQNSHHGTRFWMVPTVVTKCAFGIAASLLLLWGSQPRTFQPLAERGNRLNSEAELSAFLVNNWQNLTPDPSGSEVNLGNSITTTNEWQLLTNSDSHYR